MNLEELKIIKQAIVNEVEGYEFYKMASEKAYSEEVKAAYLELAEEEAQHIKWLKELLDSLKEIPKEISLGVLYKNPAPNIFSWDKLDRKDAAIAVSVFGIGIQLERAAVAYYTEAKDKCVTPAAKSLFDRLIAWEQSHLEQFSAQYENLKEQWWADQEYSPY